MRAPTLLLCVSLFASAASATEEPPEEQVPAKFTVLDLVFTVEDLAWTVEDLHLKETDTEITIELSADVLFDFDAAELRPEAKRALEKVAEVVRQRTKGSVRIEGHTDGKGSAAYNQTLSEKRARSVRDRLASMAPGKRYSVVGFGASKPIAPNAREDGSDDAAGRALNRRVQIVIGKN